MPDQEGKIHDYSGQPRRAEEILQSVERKTGIQFWNYILDNLESLKENSTWGTACQGGRNRSVHTIKAMRALEIPTATRKPSNHPVDVTNGDGMDYVTLWGLILQNIINDSEQVCRNGKIQPAEYTEAFDNLVIFWDPGQFDQEERGLAYNRLVQAFDQASANYNNGKLKVKLHIVEVRDTENLQMCKAIQNGIATKKSIEEIKKDVQEIHETYQNLYKD